MLLYWQLVASGTGRMRRPQEIWVSEDYCTEITDSFRRFCQKLLSFSITCTYSIYPKIWPLCCCALFYFGYIIIFSCDQAALWMVQSVHPSVCLSVRLSVTPFRLCSHHRIIMKFFGVITNDRSDAHAKSQGQRSRSQRPKPNLAVSTL